MFPLLSSCFSLPFVRAHAFCTCMQSDSKKQSKTLRKNSLILCSTTASVFLAVTDQIFCTKCDYPFNSDDDHFIIKRSTLRPTNFKLRISRAIITFGRG